LGVIWWLRSANENFAICPAVTGVAHFRAFGFDVRQNGGGGLWKGMCSAGGVELGYPQPSG
jgi:hypothetical protein